MKRGLFLGASTAAVVATGSTMDLAMASSTPVRVGGRTLHVTPWMRSAPTQLVFVRRWYVFDCAPVRSSYHPHGTTARAIPASMFHEIGIDELTARYDREAVQDLERLVCFDPQRTIHANTVFFADGDVLPTMLEERA